MTAGDVLQAFALPAGCQVDRRVPKTLWPDGLRAAVGGTVEELRWLAVLKPGNAAVPATADVAEIQFLGIRLRPGVKPPQVAERVQRAVPYAAVLLVEQGEALALAAGGAFCDLGDDAVTRAWAAGLALARQDRTSLGTLYAGWEGAVRRLGEPARLEQEMARLRSRAAKEKRLAEVAEINLRLQRLQSEFAAARAALG
ncbi:MAG TPA: DUF4391 domain-containing protein [Terriglobales bacterium]|jgi:hypothetical protein